MQKAGFQMRIYEDIFKTSEGRLPQRSYYIPKGNAEYILLNGTWKFKYFARDIDVPEYIDNWDSITVPSCWQTQGFENPNYVNVTYPYPVDPPYVPDDNPCGVYERTFNIDKLLGKVYFVLEGVSSCAFVYVNGGYVGFTQGSHLQAEFDITKFANEGENTITVKVLKWCCGSYLEDQDFFRMNGIFRDCYILVRPQDHISDVYVEADAISGEITVNTDKPCKVSLFDNDKNLIAASDSDGVAKIIVENPVLWNAEKPYLYTVTVEAKGEIVSLYTAFRTIGISDKYELLINGVPVKLFGVNHHDTDAVKGWYQTDSELRRDLELMKELNINCVRTAHYPPTPSFLDMCDEMGFYVILETDIETHGFSARDAGGNGYDMDAPIWPANDRDWEKEHLERMERAVMRDRNHASIIMWSTGNESGHGPNHMSMIDWLHSLKDGRLVHCEDACRKGEDDHSDICSNMYHDFPTVEGYAKCEDVKQPVFLCEYAHAMGNGPGDVYEYAELFDKYDKLIGGCVWEWADHTIIDKNGVCRYGGDFEGELAHDANFCCDGMVFHDRSLKSGSLEVKAAFQPIATILEGNVLSIRNRLSFTNLNEYDFKYEIQADGKTIKEESLTLEIEPLKTQQIEIAVPQVQCEYGLFLNCYLFNKQGAEVARTQHELNFTKMPVEAKKSSADISETETDFIFSGEGFSYTLSKHYGQFVSLNIGGKEQLAERMKLSVWRAPTDNDRHIKLKWGHPDGWNGENYDRIFQKIYNVEKIGDSVKITGSLAGVSRLPFLHFEMMVKVDSCGVCSFSIKAKVGEKNVYLPRFGFDIVLNVENAPFTYFGYGPYESYCDMHHASLIGLYDSCAADEYVNYIRPQEHGNHASVKMLSCSDLVFKGEKLDCAVSEYSTAALTVAEHTDELKKDGFTHIRVDYKMSGIGSGSCGPQLAEIHQLNEKEFEFNFTMAKK